MERTKIAIVTNERRWKDYYAVWYDNAIENYSFVISII